MFLYLFLSFQYTTKHYFKYFPATLNAKDGRIKSTQVNNSLKRIGFGSELMSVVYTINSPTIPKQIEAMMNIFVAICCIEFITILRCYFLNINLTTKRSTAKITTANTVTIRRLGPSGSFTR